MALEAAAVLCGRSPTLCGHPARIRRTQKAFRAAKIPPNDCSPVSMNRLIALVVARVRRLLAPSPKVCNLCGRHWRQAGPFIEGPDSAFVCRGCIDRLYSIFEGRTLPRHTPAIVRHEGPSSSGVNTHACAVGSAVTSACLLCGRACTSERSVEPSDIAPICHECVVLSKQIIDSEDARRARGAKGVRPHA